MNITFDLAINVNDIEKSKKFYCEILGCELGDYEEGKWQDVNFWGNELTLHKSESTITQEIHPVDMGDVPVPHFGVHLDFDVYEGIKKRIESQDEFQYFDEPYLRFKGKPREQETFFIKDPSGNMLEIKSMRNPNSLFD